MTTPTRKRKRVKINISRPKLIYTEKNFRKGYNPIEVERSWSETLKDIVKQIEVLKVYGLLQRD